MEIWKNKHFVRNFKTISDNWVGILRFKINSNLFQNFENFHKNSHRVEMAEKSKKMRMEAKKTEFEQRVSHFHESAHKYDL